MCCGKLPRPHSPHLSDGIKILTLEDYMHSTLFILNPAEMPFSAGSLLRPVTESIFSFSTLKRSREFPSLLIRNCQSVYLPFVFVLNFCPVLKTMSSWVARSCLICLCILKLVTFVE